MLLMGRATGFEPVISCATDRRLGPLGYARRGSNAGGKPALMGNLFIMIAETGAAFNRLAAVFKKSPIPPPGGRKVAINGGSYYNAEG